MLVEGSAFGKIWGLLLQVPPDRLLSPPFYFFFCRVSRSFCPYEQGWWVVSQPPIPTSLLSPGARPPPRPQLRSLCRKLNEPLPNEPFLARGSPLPC